MQKDVKKLGDIQSYWDQLHIKANKLRVDLLTAFLRAGISDSTFYRNRKGDNELKFKTAEKVEKHIIELYYEKINPKGQHENISD